MNVQRQASQVLVPHMGMCPSVSLGYFVRFYLAQTEGYIPMLEYRGFDTRTWGKINESAWHRWQEYDEPSKWALSSWKLQISNPAFVTSTMAQVFLIWAIPQKPWYLRNFRQIPGRCQKDLISGGEDSCERYFTRCGTSYGYGGSLNEFGGYSLVVLP